ncbi:MAG: methylmalonyl Co-A mutase-associated GTPase MeaB [bacterium]|nr:methylmalonyl Co-A mutase-associated GTPase MeaB [bacterium]
MSTARHLEIDDYVRGVTEGDRAVLGRAITLVESNRPDHQEQAQELLSRLLPRTGKALRVGVTGVPGVGKSTFLDALGTLLTGQGRRIAVLAVDPSSSVSGGSILGDKTRMESLATDARAFIRPSPSGGSLGGVARKTRESILLCEAAGYDVVFVETVGVGQSETLVAGMVDSVLLLLLPHAGDELQGIKRGILELVDLVAVNKADGERLGAARKARQQYLSALKFVRPASPAWRPTVLTVSARDGTGLEELWRKIEEHRATLEGSGELGTKRREQRLRWMWALVEEEVLGSFRRDPRVAEMLGEMERRVVAGEITPTQAATRLLRPLASHRTPG